MKVVYDKNAEAGNRIVSMTLADGTPVEMDKYYTVVTNDFMATNGDNYNFTNAVEKEDTFLPVRDALMEAVEKAGVISPVRQNWLEEISTSKIYIVVPGDSIWKIAQKFGTTMEKIIEENKLTNPRLIFAGQEIIIPSN